MMTLDIKSNRMGASPQHRARAVLSQVIKGIVPYSLILFLILSNVIAGTIKMEYSGPSQILVGDTVSFDNIKLCYEGIPGSDPQLTLTGVEILLEEVPAVRHAVEFQKVTLAPNDCKELGSTPLYFPDQLERGEYHIHFIINGVQHQNVIEDCACRYEQCNCQEVCNYFGPICTSKRMECDTCTVCDKCPNINLIKLRQEFTSSSTTTVVKCGDARCEGPRETGSNCPADCHRCGDAICSPGYETAGSCPEDCSACGDGACSAPAETAGSCPQDCKTCGDGICSPGETVDSCYQDCGNCGDSSCTLPHESVNTCYVDCGRCGDGACTPGSESVNTCYQDCGTCGDGVCTAGPETATSCISDCGGGLIAAVIGIVIIGGGIVILFLKKKSGGSAPAAASQQAPLNPATKQYIQQLRSQGYSKEQIVAVLAESGYRADDVNNYWNTL